MITVTHDKEGASGLISQRIRDITHLESDDNHVKIMTASGEEFYVVGTLVYWVNALNNTGVGYHFVICDRCNAVNLDRIVCLDTIFRRAYFTEDIGPKTINCSMSKKKFNQIMQMLVTSHTVKSIRIITE